MSMIMSRCLLLFLFLVSPVLAEVPPLPQKELEKQAVVIATGKVTKIQAVPPKESGVGTTVEYTITLDVSKVTKGEAGKSLIVTGHSHTLKRGAVGSSGHRCSETSASIKTVKVGDQLTVYALKAQDEVHPLVFPTGFTLHKK
jgi:hypothetical protein